MHLFPLSGNSGSRGVSICITLNQIKIYCKSIDQSLPLCKKETKLKREKIMSIGTDLDPPGEMGSGLRRAYSNILLRSVPTLVRKDLLVIIEIEPKGLQIF